MFDFLGNDSEARKETVPPHSFDEWLKEEMADSEEFAWEGVESKYREIENSAEEVRENMEDLKKEELPEDIAPRLRRAGKSNREALANRLEGFLREFELPENYDLKTAIEFMEKKYSELEELSEKLQKNFLFLQKVQEERSKSLLESIKQLERDLEPGQEMGEIKEIRELHSQIFDLMKGIESKEGEIERIKNELKKARERKRGIGEKLDELEKEESTEEVEEMESEKEKIEKERRNMKNKVISRLSPIKRGLKKLNYLGGAPGDREELLDKYIESPFKVFKEDENLEFLESVLQKLRENLKGAELNFSEEERGKVQRDLENIEMNEMRSLKEERMELNEEIENLRSRIEEIKVDGKKSKVKSKIEKKEKEIRKLNREIDRKIKEKDEMKEKLKERIQELEEEAGNLFSVKLQLDSEGV